MPISKIASAVRTKTIEKMKGGVYNANKFLNAGGVGHIHCDIWNLVGLGVGGVVKAKDPESDKGFWVWLGITLCGPFVQAGACIGLKKVNSTLRRNWVRAQIRTLTKDLKGLLKQLEMANGTGVSVPSLTKKAETTSGQLKQCIEHYNYLCTPEAQ